MASSSRRSCLNRDCSLALSDSDLVYLFAGRLDERGAGDFIAAVGLNQSDAGSRAACLANAVGFDADELALLGDNHDFRFIFDREDRDHLSCLIGRLHVDDALAATRLKAVA